MRQLVRSILSTPFLGIALVFCGAGGCGGGGDPGADAAAAAPQGDGASVAPVVAEDGGAGPITPSPDCDRYLGCVAKVQPEAFPLALTTYQPSGPCWESEAAAHNCSQACREALGQLAEAYPERPECGGCDPFVDPACIDYGAGCGDNAGCRARRCVDYEDISGTMGYYDELEGGVCSRRCSRDDPCPPGAVCLQELHYERQTHYYPEQWYVRLPGSHCLRQCPAAPAACAAGTRCVQGRDDDGVDRAICLPDPL